MVIGILEECGCKKIALWVYEENKRAINFYEKYKFEFEGNKKERNKCYVSIRRI